MKKYRYIGITVATILAIAPTVITPASIAHADANQTTTQSQTTANTQGGTQSDTPTPTESNQPADVQGQVTPEPYSAPVPQSRGLWNVFGNVIGGAAKGFVKVVEKGFDLVKKPVENLANKAVDKATGGVVDGKGVHAKMATSINSLKGVTYTDQNPMGPEVQYLVDNYGQSLDAKKFDVDKLVKLGLDKKPLEESHDW